MRFPEFDTRSSTLREARFAPPRGLGRALRSLPPEGTLPPPWLTRALFGLLDLWCRKARAGSRLEAHVAPARPRRPGRSPLKGLKASGVLPGLTAWSFEPDGVTGVLDDRATGERIELRLDAGPGVFRRTEPSEHLQARRAPGLVGRRPQLDPGCRALPLAYDELAGATWRAGVRRGCPATPVCGCRWSTATADVPLRRPDAPSAGPRPPGR
jgi:hypothetical protein